MIRHLRFSSKIFLASALALFLGSPHLQARQNIDVMSYNVENLFDTQHDVGKNDWAYLPKSFKDQNRSVQEACKKVSNPRWRRECFNMDWSREVLNSKIENVSRVIQSSFNGRGPDILALQEVENYRALSMLKNIGLRHLGYRTQILIEGPDERGIDTALLSRYPAVSQKIHLVDLPETDSRPTRGILEVVLQIGSKKLAVFVNHWPSQGNPTSFRVAAAKTLRQAAQAAHRKGYLVIALGDFNSKLDELRGDVGRALMGSARQPTFVDGIEIRLGGNNRRHPTSLPGTHWYRGRWSFLDRLYIMQESMHPRGIQMDWLSLDAHDPSFALSRYERRGRDGNREIGWVPNRFDADSQSGYSDHMPLIFRISL